MRWAPTWVSLIILGFFHRLVFSFLWLSASPLDSFSKEFRRVVNPFNLTNSAFLKIVNAIQTLDKSQEKIAYEDAYRNLKDALKNLEKLSSDVLENMIWYDRGKQSY